MRVERGFFSIFLAAFAIALVIGLLYAQSTEASIHLREEQLFVAQQQISKEWSLARNVYVNFASDAILHSIRTTNSPSSANCNAAWGLPPVDFGIAGNNAVPQHWVAAYNYMKDNYGVDCRADLSATVHNQMVAAGIESYVNPIPNRESVVSDQRAYAMLTCTKKVGQVDLNYVHPFVIKKRITITGGGGLIPCTVSVFDVLGSDPGLPQYDDQFGNDIFPPVPYQYRDANQTFP